MTRLERAASVAQMKSRGLTHLEIAGILGLSRSYVSLLWADPDGSKEEIRKNRARGRCEICGGPTSYNTGGPSKSCSKCQGIAYRVWSRDKIVEAIRSYALKEGRPPNAAEWCGSCAPYPTTNTVQRYFGSWSEAIMQAGFQPSRYSYRGRLKK